MLNHMLSSFIGSEENFDFSTASRRATCRHRRVFVNFSSTPLKLLTMRQDVASVNFFDRIEGNRRVVLSFSRDVIISEFLDRESGWRTFEKIKLGTLFGSLKFRNQLHSFHSFMVAELNHCFGDGIKFDTTSFSDVLLYLLFGLIKRRKSRLLSFKK
jgi:hypothetical protein